MKIIFFFFQYLKIGLLESTVVPNTGLVSLSYILLGAEEGNTLNTLPCAPTQRNSPKTVVSSAV